MLFPEGRRESQGNLLVEVRLCFATPHRAISLRRCAAVVCVGLLLRRADTGAHGTDALDTCS